MKRRDFIKKVGAGVVGIPLLLREGDRLYGMPSSINPSSKKEDLLRLQLARGDIPVETWDDIIAFKGFVSKVLENPGQMSDFSDNPKRYMSENGFRANILDPETTEMRILRALADPLVHEAQQKGDLETFFLYLEKRGVFERVNLSRVAQTIARYMEENARLYFKERKEAGYRYVGPDMVAEQNVALAAAVPVNVLAVVNVVVVVVVAVSISVCGTGSPPRTHSKEQEALLMNAVRAVKMAQILGDQEFESKALEYFIELHTEIFLNAVKNLSIFRKEEVDMERLRRLLSRAIKNQFGVC